MNDQKIIKSENSFLTYLLTLCFGGLTLCSFSYYIISISIKTPYPQIFGLLLGSILGIIGLLCFVKIYKLDSLIIYSDRIIIKSFFRNTKKVIYLNQITTWIEIEKENKYSKWKELTIFTNQTKYKLHSGIYNNYSQLKNIITKGVKRNLIIENNWYYKQKTFLALMFSLIGTLFIFGSFKLYFDKFKEIQKNEIQTINDIITNKVRITKESLYSRSIKIKLKSYPNFLFEISGNAYRATNSIEYVTNVSIGDSLKIKIMKDEYQKKISRKSKLNFSDKTINYSIISVLGLADKKHTYLSISNYNLENKNESPIATWLFGILGLFILSVGIYLLTRKKPSR